MVAWHSEMCVGSSTPHSPCRAAPYFRQTVFGIGQVRAKANKKLPEPEQRQSVNGVESAQKRDQNIGPIVANVEVNPLFPLGDALKTRR